MKLGNQRFIQRHLKLLQKNFRVLLKKARCFTIVWPDESVHYIQAFGDTIKNEAGEPIRMSGLNWDITEKVLAEEALKDQISEMERINLLMVDREKKMIALKEEITKLK